MFPLICEEKSAYERRDFFQLQSNFLLKSDPSLVIILMIDPK